MGGTERVCSAAEGFGNRMCYLENVSDKVSLVDCALVMRCQNAPALGYFYALRQANSRRNISVNLWLPSLYMGNTSQNLGYVFLVSIFSENATFPNRFLSIGRLFIAIHVLVVVLFAM